MENWYSALRKLLSSSFSYECLIHLTFLKIQKNIIRESNIPVIFALEALVESIICALFMKEVSHSIGNFVKKVLSNSNLCQKHFTKYSGGKLRINKAPFMIWDEVTSTG